MRRKIKLMWYKWQTRRAYLRCRAMLDEVDCGVALLRYISPEFAVEDDKFRKLWERYQNLRDKL